MQGCLSYVCVTQIRELLLGSVRNFRYHYFFWALSCYPKAKAKTLFAYSPARELQGCLSYVCVAQSWVGFFWEFVTFRYHSFSGHYRATPRRQTRRCANECVCVVHRRPRRPMHAEPTFVAAGVKPRREPPVQRHSKARCRLNTSA